MNARKEDSLPNLPANKVINFESPLWRIDTVLAFIPISKSSWLNGVKSGKMPPAIKIPGSNAVAWRKDQVEKWVQELQ